MAAFIKISALNGAVVAIAAADIWRIAHNVPNEAGEVHTQVDYDGGLLLTDEAAETLVADLAEANVRCSHSPLLISPRSISTRPT